MAKRRKNKSLPRHQRRKNFLPILAGMGAGTTLAAGLSGMVILYKLGDLLGGKEHILPTVTGGSLGYLASRQFKLDPKMMLASVLGGAGTGLLFSKAAAAMKEKKEEAEKAEWCKKHNILALFPGSGCP